MKCLLGWIGSIAIESDSHLFHAFVQDRFCKFAQVGREQLDSFSGSIVLVLHCAFKLWQRRKRAILWVKERRVSNLNSAFTMVPIWAIVLMHHQRRLQLLSKSLLLSGLKTKQPLQRQLMM